MSFGKEHSSCFYSLAFISQAGCASCGGEAGLETPTPMLDWPAATRLVSPSPGRPEVSPTCLLQGHHGGLLDQVALDEAAEVLAVHAQVWQLECVDGHLQRELLIAAVICYM